MSNKDEVIKFIKFNVVGVMNTAIDFAVYGVLRQWMGVTYVVAATIGYSAGIINSYICNKKWTFKNNNKKVSQVIKFIVVNIVAFSVSLSILSFFESIGFNQNTMQVLEAKFVATVFSLIINFLGSRLWVFK